MRISSSRLAGLVLLGLFGCLLAAAAVQADLGFADFTGAGSRLNLLGGASILSGWVPSARLSEDAQC